MYFVVVNLSNVFLVQRPSIFLSFSLQFLIIIIIIIIIINFKVQTILCKEV
jgi:hypothetical protein